MTSLSIEIGVLHVIWNFQLFLFFESYIGLEASSLLTHCCFLTALLFKEKEESLQFCLPWKKNELRMKTKPVVFFFTPLNWTCLSMFLEIICRIKFEEVLSKVLPRAGFITGGARWRCGIHWCPPPPCSFTFSIPTSSQSPPREVHAMPRWAGREGGGGSCLLGMGSGFESGFLHNAAPPFPWDPVRAHLSSSLKAGPGFTSHS